MIMYNICICINYNTEIETGNDIIGEGKISWKDLKKIEKNEMRTLKIPIFARNVILKQHVTSYITKYKSKTTKRCTWINDVYE